MPRHVHLPSTLRRAVAAISAVTFVLLGVSIGSTSAFASPTPDFSLSGTVTNLITYPAHTATVEVGYYDTTSNSYTYSSPVDVASGGTYSVIATDGPGNYDLRFNIPDFSSPFLTTYYGGGADEPSDGTLGTPGVIDGTSGADLMRLDVTVIPAGYITGTVTASGSPVAGADVEAYNEDTNGGPYDSDSVTDALGAYSIKVPPGTNYEVGAFATGYTDQAYKDRDGCGCEFDPVAVTASTTTPSIDFHLDKNPEFDIEAVSTDGSSFDPLTAGEGALYNAVTGGFSPVDSEMFEPADPGIVTLLGTTTGSYRLRLGDGGDHWYPIADWAYDALSDQNDPVQDPNPDTDPSTESANDVCYVPIDAVQAADDVEVIVEVDFSAGAPTCGPEPTPTTPAGTTPTHHKTFFANAVASVPTPTPTPTPTPAPSETPTSSPSPSPSASSTPSPLVISSTGGLPWWAWLLIIVVGILILAGIAFALFRRR